MAKVGKAALYVSALTALSSGLSSPYVAEYLSSKSESFGALYENGTGLKGAAIRFVPGALGVVGAGFLFKGKKKSLAQALLLGGAIVGSLAPFAKEMLMGGGQGGPAYGVANMAQQMGAGMRADAARQLGSGAGMQSMGGAQNRIVRNF